MDKYEYNLKLEEIDKLVDQKDYEEAARMADTVDWRRVRNVRTLCLISEIYEASGRLQDSKDMLMRAYRRSPAGRTVLYRLVEITTALHQYDEAMEYYTEYVQVAPHDSNRYILKYQIYRGRGASVEEQISILEEYLGQEYTERWAYELAKLYRKAGQIQKCLAACDDLVLWFHSGKYVLKALELKKKYTALTPKQQEIYDRQLLDPEPEPEFSEEPDEVITKVKSTDGEVIAESIMAETEKEIADEVTAHKAEMDQEASGISRNPGAADAAPAEQSPAPENYDEKTLQMELARSMREIIAGVVKRTEEEEESSPVIPQKMPSLPSVEAPARSAATLERLTIDDVLLSMGERGKAVAQAAAGAGRAGMSADMQAGAPETGTKSPEDAAEAGANVAEAAAGAAEAGANVAEAAAGAAEAGANVAEAAAGAAEAGVNVAEAAAEAETNVSKTESDVPETPAPEASAADSLNTYTDRNPVPGRTVSEEVEKGLTEEQREALKYTDNPERLLRNMGALPTYSDIRMPEHEVTVPPEELQKTRRIDYTREDLKKEMLAGRTIRVPVEKIASLHEKYGLRELWQETGALRSGLAESEGSPADEAAAPQVTQDGPERQLQEQNGPEAAEQRPAENEITENLYAEESGYEVQSGMAEDGYGTQADGEAGGYEVQSGMAEDGYGTQADGEAGGYDVRPGAAEDGYGMQADAEEAGYDVRPDAVEAGFDAQEGPFVPEHLRRLFEGFTEIAGLEFQIANAVIQAVAHQGDRTSRSGNILIFGPHGSGKTTLAINIAKAVAQDRGTETLKLAKVYAADFNRKDIAATIAKIAGGTLIIEEAGDLEPGIIDQLTTAMEFRTDGLLIILEDEEQYLRELLMSHPRFTMKFTAQIYLPVYTADELLIFAQQAARKQGYVIGEDALTALHKRISELAEQGTGISVSDVTELVGRAVRKSNRLLRKMSMGKKRYDEDDYIILFAKDFR